MLHQYSKMFSKLICNPRTMHSCMKFLVFLLCLSQFSVASAKSRFTRAIMLSMSSKLSTDCMDRTIMEKNATASIIVTGTVTSCDAVRAGSYSCTIQIWRVMKGNRSASGLIDYMEQDVMKSVFKKKFATIHGMGNSLYCKSQVKKDDTRIFFLNRVNNRLVLATSVVRITLTHLENTQAVIEGKKIIETPKKPPNPCKKVLCGYGATCEVSSDGNATCVCPPARCSDTDEIFAPVCGSNGVTYPNQCRLKAAQCLVQRRIRMVSDKACEQTQPVLLRTFVSTTAVPAVDKTRCYGVICGNSAVCEVRLQSDGSSTPSCVCPTCDDVPTSPLCGSDQRSHRSACDMQRMACLESRNITVVRRSPCNPCDIFNETTLEFESMCPGGICSIDGVGLPRCCDTIACTGASGAVCGSDGNTYESECALKRFACKTARTISVLSSGQCPQKKPMTTVRGSVSIDSNSNCPGNCDPNSEEFQNFVSKLEADVNTNLRQQNFEDIDSKTLGDFQITGNRTGSVVLLFRAYASTRAQPIGLNEVPESNTAWIFQRLFDLVSGALHAAAGDAGVTFASARDPADDFYVEDVCLHLQCPHGEMCGVTKSGTEFVPSCSCDNIGDGNRLAVTRACKEANDGAAHDFFFVNAAAARHAACTQHVQFTFKDTCAESVPNACASLGGCQGEGESCVVTNGVPMCTCITCGTEYKPVCTDDGQTFRSACELRRQNCVTGSQLVIAHDGQCVSKCDGVKCWPGAQCEVNTQGAICVCPTVCIEAHSPVCGSDGVTYDNECEMVVAACATKVEVTVAHPGACEDSQVINEDVGSGDGCMCRFGGVCADTIDDEDSKCTCDFDCSASPTAELCGSDRRTYANRCELDKTQCEQQKMVKIVSAGSCQAVCSASTYGCCKDGVTPAGGLRRSGCPETCNCNPFGSYESKCHPSTGQCVCRPGVGGLKCDRCRPGYWNFLAVADGRIAGCMSCNCNPLGSTRDDCDQMTGRCSCKDNVTGSKCTHCNDDGTLTWITSDLCEKTSSTTAKSCADLSCRAGQECVDTTGSGDYACKCPSITSCDSSNGASVCGSNGITYADACQMKVIACKQGIDVRIAGEGSCKDQLEPLKVATTSASLAPEAIVLSTPEPEPEAEPEPEPEPEPTTPVSSSVPEPEPSLSSQPEPEPEANQEGAMTTSVVSISTEATTTSVQEVTGSGANNNGCMGDDEDCVTGSGDGTTAEVPQAEITSSAPDSKLITAAPITFHGTATFFKAGGSDLDYAADLDDPASELFAEYGNAINSEVMALAEKQSLRGKIKSFSIKTYKQASWFYGGVEVTFDIDITSGVDPAVVQKLLNDLSPDQHDFAIGGQQNMVVHDSPYISPPLDGAAGTFASELPNLPKYKQTRDRIAPASIYAESSGWSIPQFGGASVAEFSSVESVSTTTIEMRFRTFDPEGLLLYTYLESQSDFISLAVNRGRIEFRFDTGSGKLVLTSKQLVNDSRWHNIVARRNRRDGMLQIDDDSPVQGTSPGTSRGLNLDSSLYLGGFRNPMQDRVQQQTGVSKGLTGCVQHVSIDETILSLNSSSGSCVWSERIAECGSSPCFPNPCANSANCFITKQGDVFTNKCQCRDSYEGPRCEREMAKPMIDPCASNLCHSSSRCVANTGDDGYICECPAGRAGLLCEAGDEFDGSAPSFMPAFAQDSYMQLESLGAGNVKTELSIEVLFYSSHTEGLIFYNGQRKSDSRSSHDYIALNLKGGYLEFMYDLGKGAAKIRSPSTITLDQWHVARLSRNMRHGEMTVDDGETVRGQSPKDHSLLNVNQPLYLGGVPDYSRLPASSGITTGLSGAVQKFEVNGLQVPLAMSSSSPHHNVRAFNGHACYHNPCENGGTCYPQADAYSCHCTSGYSGKDCEAEVSDRIDPDILHDEGATAIHFDGNTRAMYRNAIKAASRAANHNVYELVIRTTARHGLLLMAGKALDGKDYLALAISDGRVHLRFDLGSGPAHVVSEERINDGNLATIKVDRKYHQATLQVNNGMPQTATSPGKTRNLNTDGMLWLGGVDYQPRGVGLYKSFFQSFVGCVSSLKIHGEAVGLRDNALNSPQLRSCLQR